MKVFYWFFQNGPYCKLILLLTKYFRLTNYMWMFCEGFYLHRLISTAFAEERSLLLFYAIGWGEYNSFDRNWSFYFMWMAKCSVKYKQCLRLYQRGKKFHPLIKFLTLIRLCFHAPLLSVYLLLITCTNLWFSCKICHGFGSRTSTNTKVCH
jgi:hypothetical protein